MGRLCRPSGNRTGKQQVGPTATIQTYFLKHQRVWVMYIFVCEHLHECLWSAPWSNRPTASRESPKKTPIDPEIDCASNDNHCPKHRPLKSAPCNFCSRGMYKCLTLPMAAIPSATPHADKQPHPPKALPRHVVFLCSPPTTRVETVKD